MNERRLTPRRQYEVAYCLLRMGNGSVHDGDLDVVADEILDCAVLSYDNRNADFNGWNNFPRWRKFFNGVQGSISVWSLPF